MSKKRTRRRRGNGGVGILALLIALAVGAGYFFRDCLPNFGVGGGQGAGDQQATTEAPPQSPEKVGEKGTVAVTVKGDECVQGGQPAAPCPKICEDLKAATPKDARIAVDATVGAHAVVEEFKICLSEGGFTDVTVKAE